MKFKFEKILRYDTSWTRVRKKLRVREHKTTKWIDLEERTQSNFQCDTLLTNSKPQTKRARDYNKGKEEDLE